MRPELLLLGDERYSVGRVVIDLERWEVFRDGDEVHLTPCEFRILARLVEARGKVVKHEQLLNMLWDFTGDVGSRAVDTHVLRMRKKIGKGHIRNVYGVGYALNCAWNPKRGAP